MKFRKRPIVIEAEQFRKGCRPWPEGVLERKEGGYFMQTLEGPFMVESGDWIITGIKGEKYPCKPDIFFKTYDPAEEAE